MNNAPPAILDAADPCSPLSVPAASTAVLLLDFHSFIVRSQPDGGAAAVRTAAQLRSWAKEKGMVIVHCSIDFRAETPASRKMAARANGVREKMRSGDAAAQEAIAEPASVAAVPGEFVFYRPPSHVSALGSYGLEAFLAAHGVESLVLAGFSTSMCVLNTAKAAADRGHVVTIIRDASGDKSPEVHETVLSKVVVGQAHVCALADFTAAWGDAEIERSAKLVAEKRE